MSATRIGVLTGTRAEYGLLSPGMDAVERHSDLELRVIAGGAHLLGTSPTIADVERERTVHAFVPMQSEHAIGRHADAQALGRGVLACADSFEQLDLRAILVLGDRIEAMAGALAGSVAGCPVVHLHGGDVAEGIADDAMRHAITKLAHMHLPATESSARRIRRLGEDPWRISVVGSPGADVLRRCEALDDASFNAIGTPEMVILLHPDARTPDAIERTSAALFEATRQHRVLWLAPNHDPGREIIERVRLGAIDRHAVTGRDHLEHRVFLGLLKRLGSEGGLLIGNSSAALLEATVAGVRCVDIGPRQDGRERCSNVVHTDGESTRAIRDAVRAALSVGVGTVEHPFGDGHTGERVAEALAEADFSDPRWIRKRITY